MPAPKECSYRCSADGRKLKSHLSQDKFGLSPINVDRVDLERFPSLVDATPQLATLSAGDAIYIPDSWWHVIRSHERNVAVSLEFSPYQGEGRHLWPKRVLERRDAPGLYWAEQMRIDAAMREQLAQRIPSRITGKPIKCDKAVEQTSLADEPHPISGWSCRANEMANELAYMVRQRQQRRSW